MKLALVAIAKDEDLYLREWCEYHFKMGFDSIFIFQNDWRYKGKIVAPPGHELHLLEMDGPVKQLDAYNSWIKGYGLLYDWAGFIDVDEFVAKNSDKSLKEILAEYSNVPQLSLNWRLMGDSGIEEFDEANTSVIERFTRGARALNQHVKQLVNLSLFVRAGRPFPVFCNPHFTNFASVTPDGVVVRGPWNKEKLDVSKVLELYHFAVKTRPEFERKIARGRADTKQTREAEKETYWTEHNVNEVPCLAVKRFWGTV